jgi:hypothetical protein
MGSRAKKGFPNVKLLALNQAVAGVSNSCRDFWLLYKQMWYVPFFWSLSWFSYWILREVFVLNAPLHQVDAVNYFGAVASIVVLLLAMFRLRTNNNGTQTSLSNVKRSVQGFQVEMPKLHRPPIKHQSSIGTSVREKLEQAPQKLMPSQSGASALSTSVSSSSQHSVSQEIPSECLTCANLIGCDHRRSEFVESQVQGSESVKCPFAAEISINKAVAY